MRCAGACAQSASKPAAAKIAENVSRRMSVAPFHAILAQFAIFPVAREPQSAASKYCGRQPSPAYRATVGLPILLKTLMGLIAADGFFGPEPSAKLPLSAGP